VFASLCAWLGSFLRLSFRAPDKFDDPNATVLSLCLYFFSSMLTCTVEELRRAKIVSDVPPPKLKQGWGEYVCLTLSALCDAALATSRVKLEQPQYANDESFSSVHMLISQVTSKKLLQTRLMRAWSMQLKLLPMTTTKTMSLRLGKRSLHHQWRWISLYRRENIDAGRVYIAEPIDLKKDPAEWLVELERVAPNLRVAIEDDSREWRSHVESTADLQKVQ
jgi:intraflagellar transport protein 57